jgi:hypothetical protein
MGRVPLHQLAAAGGLVCLADNDDKAYSLTIKTAERTLAKCGRLTALECEFKHWS